MIELILILLVAVIAGVFDFLSDLLKEVKWLRISLGALVLAILVAYVIKVLFF